MPTFNDRHIQNIFILTGAGVSAESGLATFRDSGGLWEKHDPQQIATPEALAADPDLVFRFYDARRAQLAEVQPNAAHRAIARLQQSGAYTVSLVTQNVDDLHERGGSSDVWHMHGELKSAWCRRCDGRARTELPFDQYSACSICGHEGGLRPDIVFFGEMPYYMDEIQAMLVECDLFIAIGTSGQVYPAAGFVRLAGQYGALCIEVNKESTDNSAVFDQHRIGLASEEVSGLVDELLGGQ